MYVFHCDSCSADYYVYADAPKSGDVICRNCNSHCKVHDNNINNENRAIAFWYPLGESADTVAEAGVLDTMAVAFDVWQARHRKYGRGNIAATGAVGCVVRAQDKLARLVNLYLHKGGEGNDETVNDSWIDLINYAIMGYMCQNNKWPEAK